MPAYVIFLVDVSDAARYDNYKARSGPSVVSAGGRYLVRGGESQVLEGDLPAGRTVVIEFPDVAAARAWYDGPEYSEIRRLREGAADVTLYVVDGVD